MHQPCHHGVDDQQQENHAGAEEQVAEGSGDVLPAQPFVADAMLIELAGFDEAVIPAFAFMQEFVLRYAAGEDDGVHWKFLDPEMSVEEMD